MRKKIALFSAVIAAVFSISVVLFAQQSPVGIWKTVDDETKKDKSWVQIGEANGKLYGVILKLLSEPNEGKDKLCTKCVGNNKDKNIVGMQIVGGLKLEDANTYSGGWIMDPNNGKTYRCLVELQDNGQKLRVKGSIAFFFRNQYWYRVK